MIPNTISSRRRQHGFSLLELLVAMAVFLIVSAGAFTLVKQHARLFNQQQNQVSMNVGMRNGIGMLEVDTVNAGAGMSAVLQHPIGITVQNTAGAYDALNIFGIDTSTPPANPYGGTGTSCVSQTSSTLFIQPILPAGKSPTSAQATALASNFKSGDVILLVQTDGTNITDMTTIGLNADGSVSGNKVQISHNPTATSQDPLFLGNSAAGQASNQIGFQFCGVNAYVLRLNPPISYSVDATTNPANPTLLRSQGGVSTIVADQVLGFKVGASVWNNSGSQTYYYNDSAKTPAEGCTSNCGYDDNWTLIRSVRITLTSRSAPDLGDKFRNTFDGGAYRVQAVTVAINPRNLSMND